MKASDYLLWTSSHCLQTVFIYFPRVIGRDEGTVLIRDAHTLKYGPRARFVHSQRPLSKWRIPWLEILVTSPVATSRRFHTSAGEIPSNDWLTVILSFSALPVKRWRTILAKTYHIIFFFFALNHASLTFTDPQPIWKFQKLFSNDFHRSQARTIDQDRFGLIILV